MLTTLFKILSHIPLRLSYGLATFVAWLMADVVRYRRKVVLENLHGAFPEMSEKELKHTASQFYHFLADYFVETIAMGSMTPEQMKRRMQFENMECVEEYLRQGRDVSLYLGHYCNWEWCTSIPLHLSTPCVAMEIYHPLENKDADKAFLHLRSCFGSHPVAMADTLRAIVGARRQGLPGITGYIADQTPLYESTHLFVDFLNRDTPVLTGAEKISRRIKAAVFYCDCRRLSRGHYACRMVEMSPDASQEPEFDLTRQYFSMLEKSIRRQPPYWLWSHRRWKRTRQEFFKAYGDEQARERLSHL